MTIWSDEIETHMDSHVDNTLTTRLLFLSHVIFMLIINEFNDRMPAVIVIDIVAKSRGINHRQFHLELLLLQFFKELNQFPHFFKVVSIRWLSARTCFGDFDFHSTVELFFMAFGRVFVFFDGRSKQCIDKRCLTDTRFAYTGRDGEARVGHWRSKGFISKKNAPYHTPSP